LKDRQKAAEVASDKMLRMLLSFEPASNLKVADIKYIAEFARTLAFEACEEITN